MFSQRRGSWYCWRRCDCTSSNSAVRAGSPPAKRISTTRARGSPLSIRAFLGKGRGTGWRGKDGYEDLVLPRPVPFQPRPPGPMSAKSLLPFFSVDLRQALEKDFPDGLIVPQLFAQTWAHLDVQEA